MGNKNQLWWDLPPMESYLLNKEIYDIPKEKFESILKELSSLLEIEDILNVQVRKLSLGQRMKAEIIAALLHSPKVMFLDEPTIGLDVVVQKRIREFFKMHNEKYQTTIILTSHYMDDVKELCKRVIIIDKGRVIYDGSIDDIIRKYAQNKYLSIVLHESVKKEDWEKFGDVVEYQELKVTLSVPRSDHAQIASQILTSFKVDDLDIKEIELEDVIRKIFGKN
jgi:ABC-2 type transport system ATP-binding protein